MRFTTRIVTPTQNNIQEAARLLKSGQVVALPTETVYGLAANALSINAVQEIFNAKERPTSDPLIVHISERFLASPLGALTALALEGILSSQLSNWKNKSKLELLMSYFWPGPLTLVLPKGPAIPDLVTSGQPSVALRCPAHPTFQQVLSAVPFPLAAPSANRFGRISPTRAQHVYTELAGAIPLIVDGGPCQVGLESTILYLQDETFRATILRSGKISAQEIETIIKLPVEIKTQSSPTPIAPGMLDEHYSPQKLLSLSARSFTAMVPSMAWIPDGFKTQEVGVLSMGPLPPHFWNQWQPTKVVELSAHQDLREIARRLFLSLRELDEDPNVKWIIADVPEPLDGLGLAIRDRLNRASKNKPI